ncbi:MAG: hypothetical protein AB3A66_30260 (plasmid) [Nodularia sp. CChRGM 3473]
MSLLIDETELINFVKQSITNTYNDDLDCIFRGVDDVEIKSFSKLEDVYEYEFRVFARAIFQSDYHKDEDLNFVEPEYMELSVYVFVDEYGFEFDEASLERIN